MGKLLEQEWLKTVFVALILIGVGLSILGVITFVTSQYQSGQVFAYKMEVQRLAAGGGTGTTDTYAQMLFAADQQINQLESDSNRGLIFAGGGLILIAIGWLGREMSRSKSKVKSSPRVAS